MDNQPQSAAECVDIFEDMSLDNMEGKRLIYSCIKMLHSYNK